MRRLDLEHRTRRRDDVPIARGSQGRILHLLPDEGARPTDLAAGGWITKQAVGQRVRELEELGLVETHPDPDDGRAIIVSRTTAGDRAAEAILDAIDEMERAWAQEVGEERYAVFRAVLDDLGADHAPDLVHRPAISQSGNGGE
ncbi:MAG TPA: MarR family winged helix-turn-helix transcriptional regulator [Nitriliruptoraceae bacterium]|nr:MarR family winged helix-turn-helix transcriptional regulator [Nitriliruptoraceae bacterium]